MRRPSSPRRPSRRRSPGGAILSGACGNWDDVGTTLRHRAAGWLDPEPLAPPTDPGACPPPVMLAARTTCALHQELRAAGFDTDSHHPFARDAWVTELHVAPWGSGVMEVCRDRLLHSWCSRHWCYPEVNWADMGPTLIRDLAGVGCDVPQGMTPTVVHWAAHANAALRGELRCSDLPIGAAPDDAEPWEE